jgi:glycosyltransferase involved in cell wall biosynthesis
MRVLFALPGLHRFHRGAEIAFISIANELASMGHRVTLMGSGEENPAANYDFNKVRSVRRELFEHAPSVPILRNECAYEELTFSPGLLYLYRPANFDITVTCSYPFTNWILRRPTLAGTRPRHIFITQNGDWPAYSRDAEFRLFGCDGLVCTNPDFYERNNRRWPSTVIPNGVDIDRFKPGPSHASEFGFPDGRLIVLVVSALIESKRVELGVEAVSLLPHAHLVVAGDGPLREKIAKLGSEKLGDRFTLLSVPSAKMPDLYRSSDLLLHLSKEEAFGNVYIEAMATGIPVVAPDTPRVRWIVGDGETLFSQDTPSTIASTIERSQADRYSPARVERAERFSWRNVGKSYETFMLQILARKIENLT